MYTAIVLNEKSVAIARNKALSLSLIPKGWTERLHHCTVRMGASEHLSHFLGDEIKLTVVAYGIKDGRATAFKVIVPSGAMIHIHPRTPHVTIATNPPAKPKESNEISHWKNLDVPFDLTGTLEICE